MSFSVESMSFSEKAAILTGAAVAAKEKAAEPQAGLTGAVNPEEAVTSTRAALAAAGTSTETSAAVATTVSGVRRLEVLLLPPGYQKYNDWNGVLPKIESLVLEASVHATVGDVHQLLAMEFPDVPFLITSVRGFPIDSLTYRESVCALPLGTPPAGRPAAQWISDWDEALVARIVAALGRKSLEADRPEADRPRTPPWLYEMQRN